MWELLSVSRHIKEVIMVTIVIDFGISPYSKENIEC